MENLYFQRLQHQSRLINDMRDTQSDYLHIQVIEKIKTGFIDVSAHESVGKKSSRDALKIKPI